MECVEEVIRYGSLRKGQIYKRDRLEEYVDKYKCMLIESGAKRGMLSCDYDDDYIIRDVIQSVGGSFFVGKTVISNKYFEQAIIIEKIYRIN